MKRSRQCLLTILALQAINGLMVPDARHAGPPILVVFASLGIAIPVAIYAWCQADITERNIPYPAGIPILVGVIPPVGLPLYFLLTRPPLGALAGISNAVMFVLLAVVALLAGAYLRSSLFT